MSLTPRTFIMTLLVFFTMLLFCGCKEERVYRIGVSQCSRDDWRNKMNEEILREIMFHDDAEVEIRSADDSSEKQIADILYFVENGFDIIMVSPNEAAPLTPVIEKVHADGIPVILYDRQILSDSYTARIGVDNEAIGSAAAHYALHLTDKSAPKALEIFGLPGSSPAEGRHSGFASTFKSGGGEIIASVPANWKKELAMPVVDSLLRIYPDVDLIFAHNDRMAIGASEVADSLGRNLYIIGIDAAPSIGLQAVADGVIDATFLYPTEGHLLVRTALAILKNEPFERETVLPVSSAVDKSNADILLLQNEALNVETEKIRVLKDRIDDYWDKYSSQSSLFYASIVIIILLFCGVFLILRSYWQNKRHQQQLLEQYRTIEEERDKQQQLNEMLQEATQSKLMFFTNVSHDLRTPLTLISEPVAQLAEAPNLTPQQHTLMRIADKNVRILRRLINQILDFRKYENNKLELHLTEINLCAAVADWVEAFNALACRRSMKLSLDSPQDCGTGTLAVDVEKIERVFFNLLSNAFKYTPDNGRITVSCRVDDDKAVISVTDTGEGISERDLGNIFDRFYQVNRVHPNGSGIGLSLSKAFVEMHGGSLTVESELNKGSVFTITIPVTHVSATAAISHPTITPEEVRAELEPVDMAPEFADEKPLLLVIDDNKDIRDMLTQLLNAEYNVLTAPDGAEGIRKAMKYVPDLIICDVMMPVMDGLECCSKLKGEVSTSHIPVLMLTACTMDEQRVQGYESGADGYLAKPFNSAVLMSLCSSLLLNRRRIRNILHPAPAHAAVPAPKPSPKSVVSAIDNEFYNRFLEVFNAGIRDPDMSVDSIASRMGLERSQFYRKIKALTNFSPVELMRNLRLARGRSLLTTTDKSISEIAYEIGFSTPAYFTKCYRDLYGETPSELRAGMKKDRK